MPSGSTSIAASERSIQGRVLSTSPKLALPLSFKPKLDKYWIIKRYVGRLIDRIVGLTWSLMWLLGFGNAAFGIGNFLFGLIAWRWWNATGAGERDSRSAVV